MATAFPWKRALPVLLLAALLAAGCSKKQTVRSDAGTGSGETAASAPGAGEALRETPISEAPVGPDASASQSPTAMAKAAEAGVAVTQEKPSRFPDVPFEFDKADVTAEGKKICQEVADYMRKNPTARLLIEGHCDERGTAEYNLVLGERRATAVRNYLVSLGVPKGSLATASFGKERPVDPGHTENSWSKNRRVHFVLK